MKIKKEYTFTNKKQIWRLLPTTTGRLVIEERDPELKEAFFSCLDIKSGKKIFNKEVIEEKFWIGIEKIYKDIIFFHKFKKPDMPGHIGIYAFDISRKNIVWKNDEQIFLFAYEDNVYSYKEKYENRIFLKLDYLTGEIKSDLGNNSEEISILMDKALSEENYKDYLFTNAFIPDSETAKEIKELLTEERNKKLISGKIDYLKFNDILLFSYHEILNDGKGFNNLFKAIDISKGKVIFEEVLNRGVKNFIPDSFFIKDNLLFLLKEKTELIVCSLND